MRLSIAMAASLLAGGTCAGLAAAGVTVDQPSPPPCCADGLCYPKTGTWGYYQARWRRWPGEELPTPAAAEPTPAERVGPEIQPFEAPPPEEEDRRAPPPTERPAEPAPAQPATPPMATPPTATPPTATPPTETPPTTTPPTGTPMVHPDGGMEIESPVLPGEGAQSSGEWDPPPELPSGTAEANRRPDASSVSRLASRTLHFPGDVPRRSSASDLPPPLPLALDRVVR